MSDWRPINTAPTDGTMFLAWAQGWGTPVVLYIRDDTYWMPVSGNGRMYPRGARPVLWTPIASPYAVSTPQERTTG